MMLLSIDIETDTSAEPFEPGVPAGLDPRAAAITQIALVSATADGDRRERVLVSGGYDGEADMLIEVLGYLEALDSGDIVVTWNGLFFDFPYLAIRCEIHGLGHPFRFVRRPDSTVAPKYGASPWFDLIEATPPNRRDENLWWNDVEIVTRWATVSTLDTAPLYAERAAADGIKHSLGPVACHVLGVADWKLDRERIHTYTDAEVADYVAADARHTLSLAERHLAERASSSDDLDIHARMVEHAERRGVVELADGRSARLHYWPLPAGHPRRKQSSRGRRAVIRLASGAMLSVDPTLVVAKPIGSAGDEAAT